MLWRLQRFSLDPKCHNLCALVRYPTVKTLNQPTCVLNFDFLDSSDFLCFSDLASKRDWLDIRFQNGLLPILSAYLLLLEKGFPHLLVSARKVGVGLA